MRIGSVEEMDELKHLISYQLKTGRFELACGEMSDYLLDLSCLLRTTKGITLLSDRLKLIFDQPIVVGGPISGSDLVCFAFSSAGLCQRWFGVRKEAKGRGLDKDIITGNLYKTDRVWVVEDISTSGNSLERAVTAVMNYGAQVAGIFSIVERGGLLAVSRKFDLEYRYIYSFNDILNDIET